MATVWPQATSPGSVAKRNSQELICFGNVAIVLLSQLMLTIFYEV